MATDGKRILVLEDEEIVREVLGEFLGTVGFDVAFAEEGETAVKLYAEAMEAGNPFDALITDLTIPGGMGGSEALSEILKIDPNAKAIVSSGDSSDPVMVDCESYGFSAAIAKPYILGELKTLIEEIIS